MSMPWTKIENVCSHSLTLGDIKWQKKSNRSKKLLSLTSVDSALAIWDKYRVKLVPDISLLLSFIKPGFCQ